LARELSAHGREEARSAAQWLDKRLSAPCRILVSPARRAQQTAAMLTRPYETVAALAPETNMTAFLAAIDWPQQRGLTLVVGHQPILGEVAAYLLGESQWMPKTAALCWLKALEPSKKILIPRQAQATLVTVFAP